MTRQACKLNRTNCECSATANNESRNVETASALPGMHVRHVHWGWWFCFSVWGWCLMRPRLRESEAPSELRTCEDSIPAEKLKFQNFWDITVSFFITTRNDNLHDDKKGLDTSSDKSLINVTSFNNSMRNWIGDGRLLWIEMHTCKWNAYLKVLYQRRWKVPRGANLVWGRIIKMEVNFQNPFIIDSLSPAPAFICDELEPLICSSWPAFQSILVPEQVSGGFSCGSSIPIIPWFVKQTLSVVGRLMSDEVQN